MLILLLAILLILTASLSLNTYLRLRSASKTYSTPHAFEDASHISLTYVKIAEILMILILIFAVSILFLSYKN